MKTILRKELQILLKERGTFFWLILLPLFFIILFASIFGNMGSSVLNINYIDLDHSSGSKAFIADINRSKAFKAVTDTEKTLGEQKKKVRDGKLSSLLIIPKGYEANRASNRQTKIELYRTSVSDETVESAKAFLQNLVNGYREGQIRSDFSAKGLSKIEIDEILTPPIAIVEKSAGSTAINAVTQYVPGYTVMFVFFIIISMIRAFLKERDSGMLARLRSTPMKPLEYLIGMWLSYILAVLIQCAVLLGFGRFVYNMSMGDLSAIIPVVLSLAICVTGIGLALSFFVGSENQGVAFTQLIAMGGAVVSGLWFPFDYLPAFAQNIGHFMPQYWAQKALIDIMVRGAHLDNVLPNIAVLLVYGALGVFVASLRFKRYILSASN